MGNIFNNEKFIMERLIDGEHEIYIGLVGEKSEPSYLNLPSPYSSTSSYSSQAIKIGHNCALYRLKNFTEYENTLIFEYECEIILTLSKNQDKDKNIIITLQQSSTNTHIIKPMDLICRKIFKSFNFNYLSIEYDKISNFIKLNELDVPFNQNIYKNENDNNV